MTAAPVAVVSEALFEAHDPGEWHPECPGRLVSILAELRRSGQWSKLIPQPSRPVTERELLRVHTPGLVDYIWSLRRKRADIDGDTAVSPRSVDAAEHAAGGGLELVDFALREGGRGLALVRPPGHHATPDTSMGFCLFNNVALAAAHALEVHGLERVAIIDWDVHHGNGTQDIFYQESRVLYFSIHQYPLYPGTGHYQDIGQGGGLGWNINVPLPAGTGDGDALAAFDQLLRPALQRFKPQLILVSAGFDGHRDDPLAGWRLTEDGFGALAREINQLAEEHCGGRWLAFLEGGYNLEALAASMARVVNVLLGQDPGPHHASPTAGCRQLLGQIRQVLERAGAL